MDALTMLRRWVSLNDFAAVREGCLDLGLSEPAVQVLYALAELRSGETDFARRLLDTLSYDCLDAPARIDFAAVHMALGEVGEASELLESQLVHRVEIDTNTRSQLLARLAWCRQREGRSDAAVALFEASLAQQANIVVYLNLLQLYRDGQQLDKLAECLSAAQQCLAESQNDWPENLCTVSARRLRALQLDVLLGSDNFAAVEYWLEEQRHRLGQVDWCELICEWTQRLLSRDRYAQAEECLVDALHFYPDELLLIAQCVRLAQLQGRYRQAIALLYRAINVAEQSDIPTDMYWTRLSSIALQFDVVLARHAAERARDVITPEASSVENIEEESKEEERIERRLNVELALAGVEAHEGNYDAAQARYRNILKQRPRLAPALEGLGRLCMQLGRIDEAVELFELLKTQDATRGYGALINARHFPADTETLAQLETLARSSSVEGSLRTGLMFQLAAAWEKRGGYAKAFNLADEANEVTRRRLRYDPTAHRRRCARIRQAFPRALYENRDGGLPTTVPVFIVGMPRSGTTLVEQILASHSRIHGAGELGTIPRVIAGLERWERKTGSGRHYPDCVDDLDPQVISGIAQNVLNELQSLAPKAAHVCDKLPHNFLNIGLIRLLFPEAKIISVRRDPRDVAISNYFTDYAALHGGMGFAYDLDWIGEQLADHNLLMHHWHQLFPDNLLEIQYETLVADLEAGARQLLDYVGVAWEPHVLDFHSLERPVKTASIWQVRQPIYASSIQRWRHYEQQLAPLVAATNRRFSGAEVMDMITLPEPGWLNAGVDAYRAGEYDSAEHRFKLILHHLPEHGAAQFMLGQVYVRKGHVDDGIALMRAGLKCCPWNLEWRQSLAQAYRLHGQEDKALLLEEAGSGAWDTLMPPARERVLPAPLRADYIFTSEESAC